ncbi:MAG: hypothetical protein HZA16_02700 [Nitrospirae bacterium]|nr:hypothetical protein [Nitrospirota bacterium]
MAQSGKDKMTRRPYRRRNYFINRKLQGRFTAYFLLLGFLFFSSASVSTWYFSSAELGKYVFRGHVAPVQPWDIISPFLVKNLFVSSLVLIGATYLLAASVFRGFSSRLVPFDKALERMGRGDLATEASEDSLADLNEMLDELRLRLRDKVTGLAGISEGFKATIEGDAAPERKKMELEKLSAAFREKLAEISIGEKAR